MKSHKNWYNIAGWLVFAIATMVYFFSAERTGSLWDCGEFITGAYKLQVVHPPGAPLFVLIGRMATLVAEVLSDNPENIAFAVNMVSGICTAFAATFICWITIMLGKLAIVGRNEEPSEGQALALVGSGIVAGLTTTFATSIWFSAVEGEVYAMSTMFTALTIWATIKWYSLPDESTHDRWLVFAVYATGLSIGVHLLSLLTFPALALFYYFKKYEKPTLLGMGVAAIAGVVAIVLIQTTIIVGIPTLWSGFELFTVNSLGLPVHSGLIPTTLVVAAVLGGGLYFAHRTLNATLQKVLLALGLVVIGFSTIGIVVIRANANTPINMNTPSDAMRLLPYINREQYGERALLFGPDFDSQPYDSEVTPRYGLVGDKYEIVDEKVKFLYRSSDQHFFPRMQDYSQSRPQLYKMWMESWGSRRESPNIFDNIMFTLRYQIGWMYWRYFMWNFAGKQNAQQGYYSWDVTNGNWISGINPLDKARLHDMSNLPTAMKNHEGRNRYYLLPFLFGLLGLIFHFQHRRNDALGLLALFVITGIGIIIYSNQPPNEPRERDYVLAGSMFTYAIWVGMAVIALYDLLEKRFKLNGFLGAGIIFALVLTAPILMGTQNFNEHSRRHHSGARDYASNFLNSVEENAIIFTYGDNDTYPLWYAQEVEGIRTDVRVVNLSLIAVDWYIDQLRRKLNDSPAIEMTISSEAYRGRKRVQTPYYNRNNADQNAYDPSKDQLMNLKQVIEFIGKDNPLRTQGGREIDSYYPTRRVFIPVNREEVLANGTVSLADTANILNRIEFTIDKTSLIKDDLAILDIIATNAFKRPIYFAVTCQATKMQGLQDFMQLEGLALRLVPVNNKSDRTFSVIGSGRVNTEKVYDNIMNKFKWGGFDERKLFVDDSYMPSIQSHRLVMLRTARVLLQEGKRDQALALLDKYFEAFPHMNFPYDYNAMYFIEVYISANAYDKAKPHLEILANETKEHLDFYFSLREKDIKGVGSYEQDLNITLGTMQGMLEIVERANDTEFKTKLDQMFAAYKSDERPVE